MSTSRTGQLTRSAAETYEELYVPVLFQPWPRHVLDAAGVARGHRVLDVACGTGVLAREAAERTGDPSLVSGLDINDGMLTVARTKAPAIEWRQGAAEALPYAPETFDAVVSQFGLMFFADRPAAIREMLRVLRPGGRLAVAVWDRLEASPRYAAWVDVVRRALGDDAAAGLRSPYVLGDPDLLRSIFTEAGLPAVQITTTDGAAEFPSLEAFITTDLKGWVLAEALDDRTFETVMAEARAALGAFVDSRGRFSFEAPAHIVSATKN